MNQFVYHSLIVHNLTHFGAVTRMEGLVCLQASHKGYRAHFTRTYGRIAEITNSTDPITSAQMISLKTALQQLQQKKVTLEELDTRIADSIEETMALEEEICNVEEYRIVLSEKIAFLQDFIKFSKYGNFSSSNVFTPDLSFTE